MAKIMSLVDPKILDRMTAVEPINPLYKNISELDNDMQAVLQRTDLTDREKVQKYNNVLQRYLEYQDHHRFPTEQSIQQQPQQQQQPPESIRSPDIEADILNTVPKTLRRKAQALLDRIKRNPDMAWNDRGEFVYKDKVYSNSNIVDLINDTIRQRKAFQPHRWQDFARALRQTNVPQDLVGHRERWEWMHRDSATSDAFSTADEDMPEIKHQRLSRSIKRSPSIKRSRSITPHRSPREVKPKLKWESL